jgi:MOSC domain-containing protein YiiM
VTAEIVELLVSPVHRLAGRPAPLTEPVADETVDEIQVRAGLGIVGDRYFNQPAHRNGAVTIMSAEALEPYGAGLRGARRNILVHGVDVDSAVGRTLALDTGGGTVVLRLRTRANPCAWLEYTVGAGAWRGLRGRGGVRCEPLTDGILRVGPVSVEWLE